MQRGLVEAARAAGLPAEVKRLSNLNLSRAGASLQTPWRNDDPVHQPERLPESAARESRTHGPGHFAYGVTQSRV